MSILEELIRIFDRYDVEVVVRKKSIRATHNDLPVSLIVRIPSKEKAVIELRAEDELSDTLVDLVESEEDVEDIVDNVLSELRDLAIEASKYLEDKGYNVVLNLREGENDVRDMLEEIREEYGSFEEEE
ncbi:MAG: hypothetical protein B6U89_05300 [Desulfurococcales archaeon ex4484_58]|nr:MAG: hypothetical protein B6U89_05300 [Desulfurococcales archaeon ex4484_58]